MGFEAMTTEEIQQGLDQLVTMAKPSPVKFLPVGALLAMANEAASRLERIQGIVAERDRARAAISSELRADLVAQKRAAADSAARERMDAELTALVRLEAAALEQADFWDASLVILRAEMGASERGTWQLRLARCSNVRLVQWAKFASGVADAALCGIIFEEAEARHDAGTLPRGLTDEILSMCRFHGEGLAKQAQEHIGRVQENAAMARAVAGGGAANRIAAGLRAAAR